MGRKTGTQKRYHGYYRADLLNYCLKREGFNSPYALAKHLELNSDTTYRVFKGTASHKQVWHIAEFFKVDWKLLHDLTLSPDEFHRVVLSGDSGSVR